MPHRALILIALVLIALGAVAGAPRAAVAPSGAPPPLQWAPCADTPDAECAGIEVPVDHAGSAACPPSILRSGRACCCSSRAGRASALAPTSARTSAAGGISTRFGASGTW